MLTKMLYGLAWIPIFYGGLCVTVSSPRYAPLLRAALWASAGAAGLLVPVWVRGGWRWRVVAEATAGLAVLIAAEALHRGGRFW